VYSPRPLSTPSDAHAVAREFAALLSHVLCVSVSRTPLQCVPVSPSSGDWARTEWLVSAGRLSGAPVELTDDTWLLVQHRLGVREKGGCNWLTTLSYSYRWQATADDGSWIVAWDYERDTDRPFPAHVHVRCAPTLYPDGRPDFAKVHLPSGRVLLEDVIRFLVIEQKTPPRSNSWEETLSEAARIFRRIQAERLAADLDE